MWICSVLAVDEANVAFNDWFAKLLPSDSSETKPPNQVEIRSTPGMGRGVYASTDWKEVGGEICQLHVSFMCE